MKVLFLPSWYYDAGRPNCGIFFKEQALILKKDGIDVDVVYVEPRSIRNMSLKNISESHFQCISAEEEGLFTLRRKGWNPWLNSVMGGKAWALLSLGAIEKYIELRGIPDIIHAHSVLWGGYAAFLAGRKYNIPYLVTEHSSELLDYPLKKSAAKVVKTVFSSADIVVSVSDRLSSSLQSSFNASYVVTVPNVVDVDFFTLPPEGVVPKGFVFLVVASLDENKGVATIIEAFANAFSPAEDISLVIVGDGPIRADLEKLSRKLQVQERVKFRGQVSRDGVRQAMWEASTLLLGSFRETFGIVLIEALSTGLPVIGSRSGGPEEVIVPEVGLLFPPGDCKELSRLMRVVYSGKPYSRESLRNYAVGKYGPASYNKSMRQLYRMIAEKNINIRVNQ